MEKKKILLVAMSVGMFLVIVIGAAIVILSKQGADPSVIAGTPYAPHGMSGTLAPLAPNTSSVSASAGFSPAANVPSAADVPDVRNDVGITNQLVERQPVSVDAVAMVNNPEINVIKAAPAEKTPDSINHSYGDTNSIYSSDVKIERYTPAGVAKATETPKLVPPAPVSRSTAAQPAPQSSTQVARAPVQAPKPVPAKTYNDYWVQTGSFSAKVRADNVKESLGSKGISSVIEVRDVNSKTWYRVRVGPYTSQNEAEYWLNLIQSIDGFEESQIWQSQSIR